MPGLMSQRWISSRSELNSPFSCFPLHSFLEGKLLLLTAKLCVLSVFSFSFLFLCCPISCSIFCFHALFTFTAFYCLFLLVFYFCSSLKFFSPHLPGFHFNFFFSLNFYYPPLLLPFTVITFYLGERASHLC